MRMATKDEDLLGKVCACSLGRVGVISGRAHITFGNTPTGEYWTGFGFDGNGLWATNVNNDVVVVAESVADYVAKVVAKPSNLMYGKLAVQAK